VPRCAGLRTNLITKEITAAGEKISQQLKPLQAQYARDAVVKQLYMRVFDHVRTATPSHCHTIAPPHHRTRGCGRSSAARCSLRPTAE
jgi:hypothetical protein